MANKLSLNINKEFTETIKTIPTKNIEHKKGKVLLGMSGGIDSSVSAILLQKQGYEVIGATMILCEKDSISSSSIIDAKKVCEKLNIEHHVLNYQKEFSCNVVQNFIKEYQNVRTPNPCIECNRYIKFGVLYEKAKELGCNYIATGHYARIEYSEKYNQYILKKSKEEKKDQTYFLYTISKEKLSKIIFPLQNFVDKEEIRNIAKEYNLENAKKKDSQEICFIPNDDYKSFLQKHINKEKIGNIIHKNGQILGKHNGLINYTIGQRKGLSIAYKEPLYVIKLDKQRNAVIVGAEEDLYSKELYAENINILLGDSLKSETRVKAKIRYRSKEAKATIYPEKNNRIKVIFDEPQRAITPGQSIVFYQDDIVLGGGKII